MGLSDRITVRRAMISPIGCYFEGKEFLGAEYGQFLGICLVGLLIGGLVPIVLWTRRFAEWHSAFLLAREEKERVSNCCSRVLIILFPVRNLSISKRFRWREQLIESNPSAVDQSLVGLEP